MSKEVNFLIYCMERYRYLKGLSGAEVAERFSKYDIYRYITCPVKSLTYLHNSSASFSSCVVLSSLSADIIFTVVSVNAISLLFSNN